MTNSCRGGRGAEPGPAPTQGRPLPLAPGPGRPYLLLGSHAGEHLHVGDEAQQLLGVGGLQVGQPVPGEAQGVLLRQRLRGPGGQGQQDGAVDGAPLARPACGAGTGCVAAGGKGLGGGCTPGQAPGWSCWGMGAPARRAQGVRPHTACSPPQPTSAWPQPADGPPSVNPQTVGSAPQGAAPAQHPCTQPPVGAPQEPGGRVAHVREQVSHGS